MSAVIYELMRTSRRFRQDEFYRNALSWRWVGGNCSFDFSVFLFRDFCSQGFQFRLSLLCRAFGLLQSRVSRWVVVMHRIEVNKSPGKETCCRIWSIRWSGLWVHLWPTFSCYCHIVSLCRFTTLVIHNSFTFSLAARQSTCFEITLIRTLFLPHDCINGLLSYGIFWATVFLYLFSHFLLLLIRFAFQRTLKIPHRVV